RQDVRAVEIGRSDACHGDVSIAEFLEQFLDEQCFAGADRAGDHHEPFALPETIQQVRHRTLVTLAWKQHSRIRGQLERLVAQLVERLVHVNLKTDGSTGRRSRSRCSRVPPGMPKTRWCRRGAHACCRSSWR